MKPISVMILAVTLAIAASAATRAVMGPARAATDDSSAVDEELAGMHRRVANMEQHQTRLQDSIDALRAELSEIPGLSSRAGVDDIDAAVARWFEENGTSTERLPELAAVSIPKSSLTADAAFDSLLDPELGDLDRERLWQEVRDAGLLDDVIAEFEARAEADPTDPDVQVELGSAYIAKIMEVGNGPLAGVWATKADKAFDSALALDETHWDARFTKAVSLSFWPPIFGKQNEAIRHFEILVGQQDGSRPRFAQTHLLLGNMYQQIGETEEARAAWELGLSRFPGNEQLQAQLSATN